MKRAPLKKLISRAIPDGQSPFWSDAYDVAIIPCTQKKFANGQNPLTLYAGPLWAAMLYHARQRTSSEPLVLSARYGLLRLNDPIRYYDEYLPNLSADQRSALIYRIQAKTWVEQYMGKRILSYLPSAYFELLAEAKPMLSATMRRPYQSLPMMTLAATLSKEIENYGKNPAMR